MASKMTRCVGYFIYDSYYLSSSITGSVNDKVLQLGPYLIKIVDFGYIYAYYPTVILLYNPTSKGVKIVIEDDIFDAVLLQ